MGYIQQATRAMVKTNKADFISFDFGLAQTRANGLGLEREREKKERRGSGRRLFMQSLVTPLLDRTVT